MRFVFLSVICFVVSVSSAAMAQDNYLGKLRALDKKGDEEALYKALLKTENQDDFIFALDFLKEKIVDQKTQNSDYHAIYSMLLWRAGVKDTSAAMAATTLLILYTDRARCADESAGYMKITKRFSMFREMLEYLRDAPEAEKKNMMDIALDMEERLDHRSPNRELCYSGAKTTQEALKYAEEKGFELEQNGKDSYIIPDYAHIQPDYVEAAVWHKRRQKIRNEFPSYFTNEKE